ncbi:hypothetical protein [Yersinia sp. 2545 StPb PI]|uniref:hypothetical protein n=1 Tax=Yersinia sp. 2545 StPb PI TaxID=3117410 RepID=UPI003FA4CA2C
MLNSAIPTKMAVPFANSGEKQAIPVASQIGISSGRASFTDGFPPLTRTPLTAGGIPPYGTDFNGILNAITSSIRWSNAGGAYPFDSDFSSSVGGYPKGALLSNSINSGYWFNTTDANTANPENTNASLTGWVPAFTYGTTDVTGLAATNVTLTALQAANERITLAGVLTANINLVFPAWRKNWAIVNNCTGAFSVTCKTPSGTGIAVAAGTTVRIIGDGTNIISNESSLVAGALQKSNNLSDLVSVPASLANLGLSDVAHLPQLTGVVGTSRNAKMSVTAASTTATFTADELIVQSALGGLQYKLSGFSNTINLATTGAGGMNTGTAPVSGFVALYAIYNPTTQVSALLAVNATSAAVPEICGVTMPAGYTASALLTIVSTDASSRFNVVMVQGRYISIQYTAMFGTTSNVASSPTSVSGVIPRNAISVSGSITMSSTTAGSISADISGPSAIGNQRIANYMNATESNTSNFSQIPIATPSTVTLAVSSTTTTFSCYFYASGYSI